MHCVVEVAICDPAAGLCNSSEILPFADVSACSGLHSTVFLHPPGNPQPNSAVDVAVLCVRPPASIETPGALPQSGSVELVPSDVLTLGSSSRYDPNHTDGPSTAVSDVGWNYR